MKRYFILMAIILGMVVPPVSAQTAAKKKVADYKMMLLKNFFYLPKWDKIGIKTAEG